MAKKISELTELLEITGNDYAEISQDAGGGAYSSKKWKPDGIYFDTTTNGVGRRRKGNFSGCDQPDKTGIVFRFRHKQSQNRRQACYAKN